jgi:hypothetical protein
MKLQLLGPLGGKSTIQNQEESSRLDWCSKRLDKAVSLDLEIQSTGLVFQATGLGSNSRPRDPVDWMVFQATGFARNQF